MKSREPKVGDVINLKGYWDKGDWYLVTAVNKRRFSLRKVKGSRDIGWIGDWFVPEHINIDNDFLYQDTNDSIAEKIALMYRRYNKKQVAKYGKSCL